MSNYLRLKNEYKPDRDYWNRVKGFAILLVMFGHASYGITHDVIYMFHIPTFFFVSGYLYSEAKWAKHPVKFCVNKFLKLWLPFALLESAAVWLHFILIKVGLQHYGLDNYSLHNVIKMTIQSFYGVGNEILLGPIWFLRTLAIALVVFEVIILVSVFIGEKTNVYIKLLFQIIVVAVITAVGYYYNVVNHRQLIGDANISFLCMPYIWVGYFLRNYIGDIDRYLKSIAAFACVAILFFVSENHRVEYAYGIGFKYMHIIAFLGIYVVLYVAKTVNDGTLAFLGSLSFYLMCTHLIIYKLMDKFMCDWAGDVDGSMFSKLPVSFPDRWWIYITVGIFISVIVSYLAKSLVDCVKNFIRKEGHK